MKQKILVLALFLGIAGWVQAAQATEQPGAASSGHQQLARAGNLLSNGQAQAAYEILRPLVDELAGTPAFDKLFGHAALAVHKDTRAAMTFARCLAVAPRNGNCRLGLAQAHMRLNETQSAYAQLMVIKQSSPPPEVARVVKQYLGMLTASQPAGEPHFNAWVKFSYGYDTNINTAPSSSSITLPGSSPYTGTFISATKDSAFGKAVLGLSYKLPVTRHWTFVTGADIQGKDNFQAEDDSVFDYIAQFGGYLGIKADYGRHRFGLTARAHHYALAGESYRYLLGVLGQYSYFLSSDTRLSGFIQYSRLDYQYGRRADLQNVDSVSAGVSVLKGLMENQLLLFAGLYAGIDSTVKGKAPDRYGSKYAGLRGGATWFFNDAWHAGVNVLAENREYGGRNRFFTHRSREDHRLSTSLQLVWQVTPDLSLHSQYTYVHNDSNIPLREYERQIVSLGVRYEFF